MFGDKRTHERHARSNAADRVVVHTREACVPCGIQQEVCECHAGARNKKPPGDGSAGSLLRLAFMGRPACKRTLVLAP